MIYAPSSLIKESSRNKAPIQLDVQKVKLNCEARLGDLFIDNSISNLRRPIGISNAEIISALK